MGAPSIAYARTFQRLQEAQTQLSSELDQPCSFDRADAAAIHRALDEVDVKFREVLVLRFLEDFSLAEIASLIGCPEGTVKSRIHYATKARP